MSAPNDRYGPQIFLVLLALVGFVALVGGVSHLDEPGPGGPRPTQAPTSPAPTKPAAVEPNWPGAPGGGTPTMRG